MGASGVWQGLLFASFEQSAPPPRVSLDMVSPQDLIMVGACKRHGGEIARSTPASCQALFPSPEDAAACAVSARLRLVGHNRRHAPERRVGFRFCVHAGEAPVPGGSPAPGGGPSGPVLSGPGAEVAAALLALVPPGRIFCTRGIVLRAMGKVPCAFVPLGKARLGTAPEPAEVFDIVPLACLGTDEPPPGSEDARAADSQGDWRKFADLLGAFLQEDRPK